VLSIRNLSKSFYGTPVLNDINLDLSTGEVIGLIGRSGAGKSTLARCLVGLERAEAGTITLQGNTIMPGTGLARQKIQYLWQDPTQALSPYLSAKAAVLETLNGFDIGSRDQRNTRATDLLKQFEIDTGTAARKPYNLSGGQCQRVTLSRALAAEPEVLILDEPLSSLDMATQVAALNTLKTARQQRNISMLIVSHDLATLRQIADKVAVLDEGRIVEFLPIEQFAARARHPLARAYAETLAPKGRR